MAPVEISTLLRGVVHAFFFNYQKVLYLCVIFVTWKYRINISFEKLLVLQLEKVSCNCHGGSLLGINTSVRL